MRGKISIILVILWMCLIFIMSSFSGNDSSNQSGFIVDIISNIFNINNIELLSLIIRKLAHFSEFFILGLLVYNMIYNLYKKIYIAMIICILYSISDEIHQLFVSGRSCKFVDILIDSCGSILGIYFLYLVYKMIFKKRK